MASTAAMVFFWRPARPSLRAVLIGFLIIVGIAGGAGAGVVCEIAAEASNSKAGAMRVFFIFVLLSFRPTECGEKDSARGRVCATLTEAATEAATFRHTPPTTVSAPQGLTLS